MDRKILQKILPINFLILALLIAASATLNHTIIHVNQITPVDTGNMIIIDAGHGQPDGGTTSCTGALESVLNLQISARLNDLMHFFGFRTVMTRTTEDAIYTKGETIAQKKISDTRNRVELINKTSNGILISIHQNHFYESQYSGAQVFYANDLQSKALAKHMQDALVAGLDPSSRRKAKAASGVYLMEHIKCPGVLVECGFLSNSREEALLRSDTYQKQLCGVIATACLSYLNQSSTS